MHPQLSECPSEFRLARATWSSNANRRTMPSAQRYRQSIVSVRRTDVVGLSFRAKFSSINDSYLIQGGIAPYDAKRGGYRRLKNQIIDKCLQAILGQDVGPSFTPSQNGTNQRPILSSICFGRATGSSPFAEWRTYAC